MLHGATARCAESELPLHTASPILERPVHRSNMSSIKVTIKPTSGGNKFQAEIETSATVRELKEEVARKCDTAADQQRLIYKGQVLKDDRTVDSYGKLLL